MLIITYIEGFNSYNIKMKAYSLVKFEGLKNPAKNPAELQNANLSRPTDEQRQKNLDDTK
jgi:hypothetical protein